jgi:carbon monoxide dehydrogenase subunit G
VKIHGSHRFAAPREAVFAAIRDPRVLMAVIPGCEAVEQVAPDRYDGRITLRLPGAVGSYRTHVALVDVVEPERAGLDGSVEGSMGTITGHADFELRDAGAGADGAGPEGVGTDMDYHGTGVIGGPLARLDSRFAERLAESLIAQGLRALDTRLATEGSE